MKKLTNQSDNPDQLPIDILDLVSAIESLPESSKCQLAAPLKRVVEYTKRRRRRIMGLIQEALTQLRLDIKYLNFDLEATRRERDSLMKDR